MELYLIFNKHTKPKLNNYNNNELTEIIINYDKFLNINTKTNFKIENYSDLSDKSTSELIQIINELWKNHQIQDLDEIIDCVFCLSPIINSDFVISQCEHQFHSSCFFNYLFTSCCSTTNTNISNHSKITKITNLFRCPKCRNYLTGQIKNSLTNNITNTNTNIPSDYEHVIIEENTNHLENTLPNTMSNITMDILSGFWIGNSNIDLDSYNSEYDSFDSASS